jgi:hypothetical protein
MSGYLCSGHLGDPKDIYEEPTYDFKVKNMIYGITGKMKSYRCKK